MSRARFDSLSIAEHFRIFQDLFVPGVYFENTQEINVIFDLNNSVSFGNVVKASATATEPKVLLQRFPGDDSSSSGGYSTLIMLNVDGDGFQCVDEENQGLFYLGRLLLIMLNYAASLAIHKTIFL